MKKSLLTAILALGIAGAAHAKTFTWSFQGDAQSLDPYVLNETFTLGLLGNVYEGLIRRGADLWLVRMDPSQIDQILANLCVNARDAITGVGKITVETENTPLSEKYCATHAGFIPGEYVRIAVSDCGNGMDAETLAHIFEPFFTTKEPGQGMGLGLFLAHNVLGRLGGEFQFASEFGAGTTVTIRLPLTSAQGSHLASR